MNSLLIIDYINFFTLPSGNGEIECLEILNAPESKKWILWSNPNGVAFEEIIDFFIIYAKAAGCNFMAYNYKGVSGSTGKLYTESDIFVDGLTAFRHLLAKGSKSSDILLHGFSLGGGTL